MSHQDWTPVTFQKKQQSTAPKVPTTTSTAPKVKLDEEGNEIIKKVKTVTKEMSLIVSTARTAQSMTQKELAQKCNIDAKIVNDIEKGGCVYNAEHCNKIARVLNVKIPRP
jgi:ribosome-binding protein aMBF1 (putative translation factor)